MEKKIMAAEVKALDGGTNPNGEFLVTLSAPSLDRDGEIVDPGAFDPLPDHISFDIDHGMSTATTVGSGRPFYDGGRLMVRGTFASTPLGQQVRTLINEGHLRTASVAMMRPQKETKDDGVHIVKAELLNGAFVPVPANRDALILASKALEGSETEVTIKINGASDPAEVAAAVREALVKVGARNSAKDAEHIQAAHDHMVSAGASCGDGKTVSSDQDTKSAEDDDEAQQHLAMRAQALALLTRTLTFDSEGEASA